VTNSRAVKGRKMLTSSMPREPLSGMGWPGGVLVGRVRERRMRGRRVAMVLLGIVSSCFAFGSAFTGPLSEALLLLLWMTAWWSKVAIHERRLEPTSSVILLISRRGCSAIPDSTWADGPLVISCVPPPPSPRDGGQKTHPLLPPPLSPREQAVVWAVREANPRGAGSEFLFS
jgi:hypothetical protein